MRIRFLIAVLLIIAFALLACNEKVLTGSVECSECYQDRPDSAILYVYLTFTEDIDEIPLVLYNKNYEDESVDWVDTAWVEDGNPYWVYIKVDNEYSVKAEYRFKDKTIYAVDGTQPGVKHVSEVCDVDCWVIVNNKLDLEIKNEFIEQ
jgi:hypothetical protein